MNLTRLKYHHHPRPPQRELRQRGVFDSGARLIGQVTDIYVDDEAETGCDMAQGYHFSGPLLPEQVPGYLRA